MESVVKSNIFDYLVSNNLISSNQFSFSPGLSCTMKLVYVMDIITSSLDNGRPVDVISLNLQKAFDSVPRNRLLYKVESYGILVGNFKIGSKASIGQRPLCGLKWL